MPRRICLAALFGALCWSGCRREPDPVVQHLQKIGAWSDEFARLHPAPMANLPKPPLLGRTGEVGPSPLISFLLTGYPYDEMPALEKWLRGKMAADGIQEVRLHGLFPLTGSLLEKELAKLEPPPNMPAEVREEIRGVISRGMAESVTSRQIVLRDDGTRTETERTGRQGLTFGGKPLPGASP